MWAPYGYPYVQDPLQVAPAVTLNKPEERGKQVSTSCNSGQILFCVIRGFLCQWILSLKFMQSLQMV